MSETPPQERRPLDDTQSDLGPIAVLDDREPQRLAVSKSNARLDRGTLAKYTEHLADRLAATPTESIVGIRIGNEPAFVVALLACLAARRTAVAFDPLWSDDESRRATERIDLSLLLHVGEDPGLCSSACRLDRLGEFISEPQDVRASTDRTHSDTAVIHWSSGSTGRPKPIVVSRSALAFRYRGLIEGFGLTPQDRMLCLVPLTHSHGLDSILMPTLASGAELVLLDPTAATAERVVEEISKRNITVFSAFPRFYRDLLKTENAHEALASVRLPLCGSAALDPSVASAFRERFGTRIVTGYGLTEVGVVAMHAHDDASAGPTADTLASVGRLMPGVEARLHDPAADGVGELWVSSPGSADGYLRQGEDGQRIRDGEWIGTQDLVRMDAEGYITIVGRKSRFINVDGAKVDPQEIERTIEQLPYVEAAATTGAVVDGAERIFAFVVPEPEAANSFPRPGAFEAAVRQHIAERLAIHKVPYKLQPIAELPRNTLGKVLYSQLPIPHTAGGEVAGTDSTPPRTEAEREVARIWSEVLKIEPIGTRDHFIALGGSSLHLTQIHARLEERFSRHLTVVDLFRYPTVQEQAAFLSEGARANAIERAQKRALKRRQLQEDRRKTEPS